MNSQSYKIVLSTMNESKAAIYIDETLFKRWQLQKGETISITAGQRSASVEVYSFSSTIRECKLSVETSQYLSLPNFTHPISIIFSRSTNTLVIGPFLAILINGAPLADGTFGDMETFFQEMKTYCSERGFPFYLTNLQSLQEGIITGYFPTEKDWELQQLPIAHVFYNRIHSRQLEKSAHFEQFATDLQHHQIPMFNAGFLSKFEVHELLLKEEALQPYLPQSIMFQHPEDFYSFLQNHLAVYVKPIFGSQGRHIGKATKVAEGWMFEHSDNVQKTHLVESEKELFYLLKKFCENRSYIIQKGIPLLEWEHKKVDFRILLHQTKNHHWKVTSMVARIGDAGHIVSNIARGANMKNGVQFLRDTFDRPEAIRLQQALVQLAKKTAHALTDKHHGLLAELGIDVALDDELNPWIIEVNSKPSKKFEGHYDKLRPSVKAIIGCMIMLYRKEKFI